MPLLTVLLLVAVAAPGRPAAQDVFTVAGIEVDHTAETATAAREAALAEGHSLAFQKLMHRLLPRESWDRAPQLGPDQVANYLSDFAVASERSSSVRYLASLTFRFEPDSIRNLLRQYGLSYAEARSQPLVVVPLLGEGSTALLWTEDNAWRAAWAARREPGELVPLILPFGDLADIATLDVDAALAGDEAALASLAQRYQAAGALVAKATIEGDPAAGNAQVRIASQRFLGRPGPTAVDGLTQQPEETLEALLARATDVVAASLAEEWKHANLLSFGSENSLVARVELNGLDSWVEIQRRLQSLPNVVRSDPLELSRRRALISIVYLGSQQQLAQTLSRRDLVLLPDVESGWLLALAGTSVPAQERAAPGNMTPESMAPETAPPATPPPATPPPATPPSETPPSGPAPTTTVPPAQPGGG
ncbi:MAG: DUF2066 domain-containing protein [Kiloniellales bacterium]